MSFSGIVIAVDFDGVLHSYTSGWTGWVPVDPPEPGAREFIDWMLAQGLEVVVTSARAHSEEGAEAIRSWLAAYGFPELRVTNEKVRAAAYIDDRAVPYLGGDWDHCRSRILRLASVP